MKLIRWPVAAATAYVVYKYTIGKKNKGEAIFSSPEEDASAGKKQRLGSATRPKKPRARKG